MKRGKVAFCVVAWNNAAVLPECLDSIRAQTGVDKDIYLLDNGSTDNTPAVMANYPDVNVIRATSNGGFAKGNNTLIRTALADAEIQWVALINSDAVLAPTWAATLVEFAAERPHVGSLQGLTLDYYDHSTIDSLHILVNRRLQGEQYGYGTAVEDQTLYPRKVFGVNAAAALYSRAMIESLPDQEHGFFDERFFMYYEDVDVAFRALVTGWEAWSVPAAVAHHMGSISAKKRSSSYNCQMTAQNLPATAFKNAPISVICRTLLPAVRGMAGFTWWVAREHSRADGLRVALAALRGVARLPRYAASRRRIQAASTLSPNYLLRVMGNSGILG